VGPGETARRVAPAGDEQGRPLIRATIFEQSARERRKVEMRPKRQRAVPQRNDSINIRCH